MKLAKFQITSTKLQKNLKFQYDGLVKSPRIVMPVPDQVRDDGSGIQNILKSRESGFRRNDRKTEKVTFYDTVNPLFWRKRAAINIDPEPTSKGICHHIRKAGFSEGNEILMNFITDSVKGRAQDAEQNQKLSGFF